MGITELLRILKPVEIECNLNNFRGKTVGVDVMGLLYKGLFSCSQEVIQETADAAPYLRFPLKMISMLLSYGIIPVIVFDGHKLPIKRKTAEKREESKRDALKKANQLFNEKKYEEADKFFKRSLFINPKMINSLIAVLKKLNIEVIVAPYEADAQIAYLYKIGYIDFAISEDSDLLVYGVEKVAYKVNLNGEAKYIDLDLARMSNLDKTDFHCRSMCKFDPITFVETCVLVGSDYMEGIPRHGLRSSIKLFAQYKEIDEVIAVMHANKKYALEPKSAEKFKKIVCLFLFQTVFDPFERELVSLSRGKDFSEYYSIMKQTEMGEFFQDFVDFCNGNLGINYDKSAEEVDVLEDYVERFSYDTKAMSGQELRARLEERKEKIRKRNSTENGSKQLFDEFLDESRKRQMRKKKPRIDIKKYFSSASDRRILESLVNSDVKLSSPKKSVNLAEINKGYSRSATPVKSNDTSKFQVDSMQLLSKKIVFQESEVCTRNTRKKAGKPIEEEEKQTSLDAYYKIK